MKKSSSVRTYTGRKLQGAHESSICLLGAPYARPRRPGGHAHEWVNMRSIVTVFLPTYCAMELELPRFALCDQRWGVLQQEGVKSLKTHQVLEDPALQTKLVGMPRTVRPKAPSVSFLPHIHHANLPLRSSRTQKQVLRKERQGLGLAGARIDVKRRSTLNQPLSFDQLKILVS